MCRHARLCLIAMLVELCRFVDEVLEAKMPLVVLAAYSKSGEQVARYFTQTHVFLKRNLVQLW